jgi:hypothetical protein
MTIPSLTPAEQEKLLVIQQTLRQELTNDQAAKKLQMSVRQIQRLKQKVRQEGEVAVIHHLKGQTSNHHLPPGLKTKVITTIQEEYADFKPTFATEVLALNHQLIVNRETARLWMSEAGIWHPRKQRRSPYHAWRERKEYFGEMEQFDGCYHYWFEERYVDEHGEPQECCLLASIDDATGNVTHAAFAANEGVFAVFAFWQQYVKQCGKPISIYLDKFSTYKVNHKSATDTSDVLTQFQQAMRSVDIRLITANSPEAKGRIERLWKTFQDRLVKELRIHHINDPEAANSFLREDFLPRFNAAVCGHPRQSW